MKDKGKRRNQKCSMYLLYSQVAAGYPTSKDLEYIRRNMNSDEFR